MALLVPLVAACTPLGIWVYDDPTFNLYSVMLRSAEGGESVAPDSLVLVFAGCNRNDYDLVGTTIETSMQEEGREIGHGRQENSYRLAIRDSSPVTVTLAMQRGWGGDGSERPIVLESQLLLQVPSGERRVSVQQKGRLAVKNGDVVLKGIESRPCRPGISSLPSEFTRPAGIEPPEPMRFPPGTLERPPGQPGP